MSLYYVALLYFLVPLSFLCFMLSVERYVLKENPFRDGDYGKHLNVMLAVVLAWPLILVATPIVYLAELPLLDVLFKERKKIYKQEDFIEFGD